MQHGCWDVLLSSYAKCLSETFPFLSVLLMIHGLYASIERVVFCLSAEKEELFNHYLYLCASNEFMCSFDILGMILGVTVPIFKFKMFSFRVTRYYN